MKDLVERYVYDVVRRLPEQEQHEVGKELRSNIYDMLPEDAGEDAIRAALLQLGSPALLAEQYRQRPRCLISAAFYDDYLRALKWVLPLVGCILMVIGLLQGGVEATKHGITDFPRFLGNVIATGVATGISGTMQVLVWITAGFAIADRVSRKTNDPGRWSIADLPEDIPTPKKVIPLSDSIVELVVIAFFSTIGVLLCLGRIPLPLVLRGGDVHVRQLFSDSFLAACVPVILIGGVLGIGECVAKIVKRRWTPLVCGAIMVSKVTSIGLLLSLCYRQDIFSLDFLALAQSRGWTWFNESPVMRNPLMMLVVAILIVVSLAECGMALYRTIGAAKAKQG